jgi:hypothetical protein
LTKASDHLVLKALSWRVSVLTKVSDHPVLLSLLLFLCNSSDATRKWTIGSSYGA